MKRSQRTPTSVEPGFPRRTFLQTAATAAVAALAGGGGAPVVTTPEARAAAEPGGGAPVEWRNKQSEMAYRRLGRTGLMISEVVCGGDPIKLDNYQHLDRALEMGLNYLDMAPQYNQ